jgi:signal transduction histidine kinase
MLPLSQAFARAVLWGMSRSAPQIDMPADAPAPGNRATRVLSIAAHELRHPLHVMRMSLARDLPDDNPVRVNLERYIDRMTRLIQDLVDFVRTEEDALELRPDVVNLQQFLVEVMDDYRTTFDSRRIRLAVSASSNLYVRADRQRLLQVLANVLDNSLKFTPAGGTVSLEARRRGRTVNVAIRDSGAGFASEEAPAADNQSPAPAGTGHGLGVGLIVARRIVELHGGMLTVRSDGPDLGTEVLLTLPCDAPAGV